jgi:hypothetical protein|tara:strand:- start:237 stop:953 length:717 start_codon:yes stop_codon:yes gene_type:complete
MPEIKFTAQKPEYMGLQHPRPAKKFVPDWYKKMSRFSGADRKMDVTSQKGVLEKSLTIKACVPVLDFLTSGYIIPLWQDLLVERTTGDETYFNWPNADVDLLGEHPVMQVKGSPIASEVTGGNIYKLHSPWRIQTPPGYSCFFFSPFYERGDLEILPAVVDTDDQHEVNFPFLFKGRGRENLYETGMPVVQILPFKREDWSHTVEDTGAEASRKLKTSFFDKFSKKYKDTFHKKKVFL